MNDVSGLAVTPPADAPEPETPSAEGAPEGELEETTSEEPEGEGAPPDEPDGTEGETPEAAAADDSDDDDAWKNFQKKFGHLKSDRDRRAAMGQAYWEKTNYATQVRKENEELKAKLAAVDLMRDRGDAKPKEDEPPQPHPDLIKLDQRIQSLVTKDNNLIQNQQQLLTELRDADSAITRFEVKAEDADEYNKSLLESKIETAKLKKASLLQRWADINERREQLSFDVERLMSDRNWVKQFVQSEEQRKATESQRVQEFNQNFPRFVDEQIEEVATALGAPNVPKLRESLRRDVRDKMTVAFWRIGQAGVEEAEVPEMVQGFVKGYLEDRDLIGRTKFQETSKKKLAVTGKAPTKPPVVAKKPSGPVRAAGLATGELSPSMQKARDYLRSRGL
jgi:hypothetical protein